MSDKSDKKEIVSASPKVRKLAREFGADIYQIQGSQREGRVSEKDVKSFIKKSIFGILFSSKSSSIVEVIIKLENDEESIFDSLSLDDDDISDILSHLTDHDS